jgi:hypothetical protein
MVPVIMGFAVRVPVMTGFVMVSLVIFVVVTVRRVVIVMRMHLVAGDPVGMVVIMGPGMLRMLMVEGAGGGVGFGVVRVVMVVMRQRGLRRILAHDLALDPLAAAAAARIAVARTPAIVPVFVLFLGLAMGALLGLDQRLTIGDRDLVIVGMDFAEGEEAVAVAAIFDEGGLEGRFDPGNLGEVDIAAELFALGGLEIKFFDAIAADHDHPGLFRVGGIDQHFVGHF